MFTLLGILVGAYIALAGNPSGGNFVRRMFIYMVGITLALVAVMPNLAAGKTLDVNKDRAVVITGVINAQALKHAAAIERLSADSDEPIYLVIDSVGGSVLAGLQVISAMTVARERGVTIKCFVPMIAMSMAFQFFAHCDERYTLANTLLLWHPMKIYTYEPLSAIKLDYASKRLKRLEAPLLLKLIRELAISRKVFFYHYHNETIWTAEWLQHVSPRFLEIVDDASGVENMFSLGGE